MTGVGKNFRLARIFREDERTFIVAMDHGSFMGPAPGLEKPAEIIRKVIQGGADAVMTTLGVIKQFHGELVRDVSVIWAIEPKPEYVEEAVKLAVDAVKVTYFTSLEDRARIGTIEPVAVECEKWGMPLLVELVPMHEKTMLTDVKSVSKAARIAQELGADFVKTTYTGSAETFREVIDVCEVPVLVLGGAKTETDREVLDVVKGSMDAGGAGVAFGRNIWSRENPTAITRAISRILHENADVEEVAKELQQMID